LVEMIFPSSHTPPTLEVVALLSVPIKMPRVMLMDQNANESC